MMRKIGLIVLVVLSVVLVSCGSNDLVFYPDYVYKMTNYSDEDIELVFNDDKLYEHTILYTKRYNHSSFFAEHGHIIIPAGETIIFKYKLLNDEDDAKLKPKVTTGKKAIDELLMYRIDIDKDEECDDE